MEIKKHKKEISSINLKELTTANIIVVNGNLEIE